jgi:hypothetical protein
LPSRSSRGSTRATPDDDIQKGIEEIAAQTGKNVAKVKAEYNDAQRRQILIGMIIEDRVLDAIEAKANIRVGSEGSEAGAAEAPGASAADGTAEAAGASKKSKGKKKDAPSGEPSPSAEPAKGG